MADTRRRILEYVRWRLWNLWQEFQHNDMSQ